MKTHNGQAIALALDKILSLFPDVWNLLHFKHLKARHHFSDLIFCHCYFWMWNGHSQTQDHRGRCCLSQKQPNAAWALSNFVWARLTEQFLALASQGSWPSAPECWGTMVLLKGKVASSSHAGLSTQSESFQRTLPNSGLYLSWMECRQLTMSTEAKHLQKADEWNECC